MYKNYYKFFFEYLIVLTTIPIWLLILIIICILLKFFQGGKVFYKGIRIGKNFKKFNIIKFRTLKENSGREGIGDTVYKNDTRVTLIGKKLRKYKLDELPQLLQILSGKMSLIGPRPELPIYVDQVYYKKYKIHLLRPGLTDLSSIYFFSLAELVPDKNTDEFVEKFVLRKKNKYKKFYAEKVSLKLDLLILFKTIKLFFK